MVRGVFEHKVTLGLLINWLFGFVNNKHTVAFLTFVSVSNWTTEAWPIKQEQPEHAPWQTGWPLWGIRPLLKTLRPPSHGQQCPEPVLRKSSGSVINFIFFGTHREQNNFGQDYQRSWKLHLCLCLVVSFVVPCLCICSWHLSTPSHGWQALFKSNKMPCVNVFVEVKYFLTDYPQASLVVLTP